MTSVSTTRYKNWSHNWDTKIKQELPPLKIEGKEIFANLFLIFFTHAFKSSIWRGLVDYNEVFGRDSYCFLFHILSTPLEKGFGRFCILTLDLLRNQQRDHLENVPFVPYSYGDTGLGLSPAEEPSTRQRFRATVFCCLDSPCKYRSWELRVSICFSLTTYATHRRELGSLMCYLKICIFNMCHR